jgi:hypothetical protein
MILTVNERIPLQKLNISVVVRLNLEILNVALIDAVANSKQRNAEETHNKKLSDNLIILLRKRERPLY